MSEHKLSRKVLKNKPKICLYSYLNGYMSLFVVFDPGLLYFDNFKHLFKVTGPPVTKFHVEPPGLREQQSFK